MGIKAIASNACHRESHSSSDLHGRFRAGRRLHTGRTNMTDHRPIAMAKAFTAKQVSAFDRRILVGMTVLASISVAIATVSFAQSYDPDVGTGNIAYVVQPDGSTIRLGARAAPLNARGHAMIMQYGSELTPGSILYRSNNKLYTLNNQMIDGRMVEDHAKGWID
jgi:hypothetical protein